MIKSGCLQWVGSMLKKSADTDTLEVIQKRQQQAFPIFLPHTVTSEASDPDLSHTKHWIEIF